MTATKTQLTGGVFQDSQGNVLALGYLVFVLNQDNSVSGVGNIAAGIEIKVLLNSSGSVSTSPAQYLWATDVLTTANSYYRVTGYTAQGQPAWGPNNQQVTSGGVGGGTFDVGTWVPNNVFSWSPPVQSVALKTNGVTNGSQTILNLKQGSNMSITDDGAGGITFALTGLTGITLKTNGTSNGSQTLLNLVNGTGIAVTQDGAGNVTVTNTLPAGTVPAGQNICFTCSWGGTSVFPQNSTYLGTANTSGGTFFQQISSGLVLCSPTSWKVKIGTVSASTTVTLVIIKCTRGTTTVISSASVTFSGSATPTLSPAGVYQSDAISFAITTGYDYYFALNTSTSLIGIISPSTGQAGATGGSQITASNALPIGGTLPSWTSSVPQGINSIIFDWVSA